MSYLLFIDESGQDHRHSPYEVLAGAAVHDTQLWSLICAIQDAEVRLFGRRISEDREEFKAKRLLKAKVFRLAAQLDEIPSPVRTSLAAAALTDGAHAGRRQLTALAQAKIAFVYEVMDLCRSHGVRFFASIVLPEAPRPVTDMLRKDYAYLFERYFYFVEEQAEHERGLVVFDELERSQAHILIGQMVAYFRRTVRGRHRSGRVIPEPIFVHSNLTTGIQIADLVAYIVSWNVRLRRMTGVRREELTPLGNRVGQLRHSIMVPSPSRPNGMRVWSFTYIEDLRPREIRFAESDGAGTK